MQVTKDDLLKIAKILKSNGTGGEILVSSEIDPEDLRKDGPVYLIFDGVPVPFFISSVRKRGTRKAVIQLEDVCSQTDAEEIIGKDVYAEAGTYEGLCEDSGIGFLKGWTLYDADGIAAGTITGTLEIPGNPCLEILTPDGAQAYVPFNEKLLVGIDADNQEIQLEIPEGLI